jgi:hypothetical protein
MIEGLKKILQQVDGIKWALLLVGSFFLGGITSVIWLDNRVDARIDNKLQMIKSDFDLTRKEINKLRDDLDKMREDLGRTHEELLVVRTALKNHFPKLQLSNAQIKRAATQVAQTLPSDHKATGGIIEMVDIPAGRLRFKSVDGHIREYQIPSGVKTAVFADGSTHPIAYDQFLQMAQGKPAVIVHEGTTVSTGMAHAHAVHLLSAEPQSKTKLP